MRVLILFYLYVIHFNDFYYYVGKRKCPSNHTPWNDPYTGSPKTHKNKWKTTNFAKVIIECFDNDVDVSRAETDLLLRLDWENDVYCLNECCGGKFSYDANMRGALTRNKLPVNPKTKQKISRKNKERWGDPNWTGREKVLKILLQNQSKAVEASKTTEAIEKRRKTFIEKGHQQGEKNSQYGTILIHNLDLRKTKRIKKDDPIPVGWNKGAIYDFDAYFLRQKLKETEKIKTKENQKNIRVQKIKFYSEWYKIYKNVDFKIFCKLTNYSKSQQNLCAKFKEFVEEYSPKYTNKK